MIEFLQLTRSAYFYRRNKPLSNAAITRLFRDLRAGARQPSQALFKVEREAIADARYSAICFSYERDASFLSQEAGATERIYGFLMLVEIDHYVVVFRSALDLPSSFRTAYLDKVGSERVDRAIASHDAIFQKLRLRNMSMSKQALRSKSLQAADLENAVPTSSASRFVPQGYSVQRPDGTYSATPGTGRIAVRSDKVGHVELVAWAREMVELLEAGAGETSAFIRYFARSLDLSAIPAGVHPTFVGIDAAGLADAIYDASDAVRLVRSQGGHLVQLGKAEIEAILGELERPLPVKREGNLLHVMDPTGEVRAGALKIAKTRISLPGLELPIFEGLMVERVTYSLGEDPDARPLTRYIDREDLFTVLFSDLALAYIEGGLYRDDALVGGGEALLGHLRVSEALAVTASEKGAFAADQTAFAPDSVFSAVVNSIADDDVLVCDDLGDEWADFIGVSTATNPAMISFYHAKHGAQSLSASAFHDAVGQAMKNLARMMLPAEMMEAKLDSWDGLYRNAGVQTAIARLIRGGTRDDISGKMARVRAAPDAYRRVFIVTSSLSRAQVEGVLQAAVHGVPPTPHFVQLYWLLMSYFSACAEVGVIGYIVCRPSASCEVTGTQMCFPAGPGLRKTALEEQ